MEVNPNVLWLVPVIASVLQLVKAVPVAEKIKSYFPLLAVGLGVATRLLISVHADIGTEIIEGVILGLLASGSYEAIKGMAGTKTAPLLLLLALPLALAGCSGIAADARHAALIDTTAAVAKTNSNRANLPDVCVDANKITLPACDCVGEFSKTEIRELLKANADIWREFQDAKNGVNTQPAIPGLREERSL